MGNGYLSLTRHNQQFIAVYRTDEKGTPMLNDADVLVIKVLDATDSKVKLGFNGDAYDIARSEVLTGSLRDFVDQKIARLEERLRR